MRQLLEALLHCHRLDLVHRSVSVDCVMLSSDHTSAPVKLAGFNTALHLTQMQANTGVVCSNEKRANMSYMARKYFRADDKGRTGSRAFMSPEVMAGGSYGCAVDVWAAGVLLHVLLTGTLPLQHHVASASISRTTAPAATVTHNVDDMTGVSEAARDLLCRMLTLDPTHRITASQALAHKWIREREHFANDAHMGLTVERLRVFNVYRRLQTAVLAATSCTSWTAAAADEAAEAGVSQVLDSLDAASRLIHGSCGVNTQSACGHLEDRKLHSLLTLFDIIANRRLGECALVCSCALALCHEVTSMLTSKLEVGGGQPTAAAAVMTELNEILQRPHLRGVLEARDIAAEQVYGEDALRVTPPPPPPPPMRSLLNGAGLSTAAAGRSDLVTSSEHVPRVRLVQFQKKQNEPMGITLKMSEDGRCLVARVLHGGMIHRQATLRVGDEICEINGVPVAHQHVDSLQRILRESRGSVTFKVLPFSSTSSCSVEQPVYPTSIQPSVVGAHIFVRAQFDYDPNKDQLIPCQQAGVKFSTGDILQIISKEDSSWWQARLQESSQPAGLIPSPELQEYRTSAATVTTDDRNKRDQTHCSIFSKKKKLFKERSQTKCQGAHEHVDVSAYEEVVRLDSFCRRTLVLLGAHGVGRRHIKNSLIAAHPDKFAYPIPHTTRAPRNDEENGKHYFCLSRSDDGRYSGQ